MKVFIAKDKISLEAFKDKPELVECDTDFHKEWHGKCYWFEPELKEQLLSEFSNIKINKDVIEADITLNIAYERTDSKESN